MYIEWEKIKFPKKVLYMNLETTRLRGRLRHRWQDEVREDGRLVDGKGWMERVYNRQERKKLLRTARNRRILHMPMEWMNNYPHGIRWSRVGEASTVCSFLISPITSSCTSRSFFVTKHTAYDKKWCLLFEHFCICKMLHSLGYLFWTRYFKECVHVVPYSFQEKI